MQIEDTSTPFRMGIIYSHFKKIQKYLIMSNIIEASHEIQDAIKFMDDKIIPDYYKLSTTKEDSNEKDESKEEEKQQVTNPNHDPRENVPENVCDANQGNNPIGKEDS